MAVNHRNNGLRNSKMREKEEDLLGEKRIKREERRRD